MRALRLLVPLALVTLLAIAGSITNYLVQRENLTAKVPQALGILFLYHVQPVPGRVLGPRIQVIDVACWLLGIVVLVAVVAAFVLLGARSGRGAAFLAGWLGTIVGAAVGGGVSALVYYHHLFPGSSASPGYDQHTIYLASAFNNGLYWGAFAGILVGLAAMVVPGRRPVAVTTDPVPATTPA